MLPTSTMVPSTPTHSTICFPLLPLWRLPGVRTKPLVPTETKGDLVLKLGATLSQGAGV